MAGAIGNDVGAFGKTIFSILNRLQDVHHDKDIVRQPPKSTTAVLANQAPGLAVFSPGDLPAALVLLPHCFARCLSRLLLLILTCWVVIHVGSLPFVVNIASLSALRRIARRETRRGVLQGQNRKPQLRERSESERVRILGAAEPLQGEPAGLTFSAGEGFSAKHTTRVGGHGREHGMESGGTLRGRAQPGLWCEGRELHALAGWLAGGLWR